MDASTRRENLFISSHSGADRQTSPSSSSGLWEDESGAVVSAEVVLISTIVVIGVIVGLKSLRDAIVSELADVAQAVANLNQSHNFRGIKGHSGSSAGSRYEDSTDYCDTSTNAKSVVAPPENRPRCIVFTIDPKGEAK